jgi:Leucine-rich repeat (LRR) protein
MGDKYLKRRKWFVILTIFILLFTTFSSPISATKSGPEVENSDQTTIEVVSEDNLEKDKKKSSFAQDTEENSQDPLVIKIMELQFEDYYISLPQDENNNFVLDFREVYDENESTSVGLNLYFYSSSEWVEGSFKYKEITGTLEFDQNMVHIPFGKIVGQKEEITFGELKKVLAENGDGNITFTFTDTSGLKSNVTLLLKETSYLKTIDFPDPNLQNAIKDNLGIQTDSISLGLLQEIEELYLYDSNITDLTGLENAINLNFLDLSYNDISDLTPLKNLLNLNTLYLNENPNLTDINILSNLKSIETLTLENTSVTDLSPLLLLPNLKQVFLYALPIDFEEDSEALEIIRELESKGVEVNFEDPRYISVDDPTVTATTIHLTWESVNGEYDKYAIYLDGELLETLSGETKEYLIENLQPHTEYEITIMALGNGNVIFEYGTNVTTLWYPEDYVEVYFNIVDSDDKPNESYYDYSFILKGKEEHNKLFETEGYLAGETLLNYNDEILLLPYGKYDLVIYGDTYSKSQHYEITVDKSIDYKANPIKLTFDREKLVGEKLEIKVKSVTEDSIDLEWNAVPNVSSYTLRIYGYSDDEILLEPNVTSYSIQGLDPNTLYQFNLQVNYWEILQEWINFNVKTLGEVSGEVVHIPDANLKQAIREELGVYFRDITTEDMEELTYLHADNRNIRNLTGLEYATNLESLTLYSNKISDVSALSKLTQLTYLDLDDNLIEDPSPLASMTQLEELYIYNNPLQTIDALLALIEAGVNVNYYVDPVKLNLKEVTENSITVDWKIMSSQKVEYLELFIEDKKYTLDGNESSYTFEGLQPNKTYYIALNAFFSDDTVEYDDMIVWTGKYNQVQFKLLNLPDKELDFTLQGIVQQNDYIYIDGKIDDNSLLTDWDGENIFNLPVGLYYVSFYTADEYEDVKNFVVEVKEGEDYIQSPIVLDFNRQGTVIEIKDAGLEAAIRDALGIFDRDLTDVDLELLTYLYADNFGIKDLSGIENAKNLTGLDLRGNQITDISPLKDLTHLNSLTLWDNEISDISALENLTNLTYLDLDGNNITDITKLKSLTNLEVLYLHDNPIDFENTDSYQTIITLKEAGTFIYYDVPDFVPSISVYTKEVTENSITIEWYVDDTSSVSEYSIYLNQFHNCSF